MCITCGHEAAGHQSEVCCVLNHPLQLGVNWSRVLVLRRKEDGALFVLDSLPLCLCACKVNKDHFHLKAWSSPKEDPV